LELDITVPKGLERLRVSINVGHSEEDFIKLCENIKNNDRFNY
jgi:8-amino-7-oxononanoate synthase